VNYDKFLSSIMVLSMMSRLIITTFLYMIQFQADAIISPKRATSQTNRALRMSEGGNAVESISLAALTDHETEATLLAESVARWLDTEWMPQNTHTLMGSSVRKSYLNCCNNGDMELMSIMMKVASDLEADWKMYDKEAFVNAWDVANYVSDYLTRKSGSETCECSSFIF
jgi:hypothetical protein